MRKISLEDTLQVVRKTVNRFPFVIFVSVLLTILAIFFIHNKDTAVDLYKLFSTLIIAFFVYIGATLFSEQKNSLKGKIVISYLTLFFVFYYFVLATDISNMQQIKYFTQYFLWLASAILFVFFAPFIRNKTSTAIDFWNYCKRIFYSFFVTSIYSIAIYAGLSIALLSTNFLFDLNIDSIHWLELWIVTVGMFSTTFFLSRFPKVGLSEEVNLYPKELKKFTYYVLAPLVCIYFLILYSYTAKILVSWVWPKGVVSSMILGFSILGIFTYLILYPLILVEARLQKISNIFFLILLPQIAVLFFALLLRISDYGITEKRYLLIVFGFWILVLSIYFLVSRVKNIRLIAISLFVIFFGISFGPWGISSVSEHSQINRLKNILEKDGILVEGHVQQIIVDPSYYDKNEISEIVRYLYENHGFKGIEPWFDGQLVIREDTKCSYTIDTDNNCISPDKVTKLLGVTYVNENVFHRLDYYSYSVDSRKSSNGMKVSGYDYLLRANNIIEINGNTYRFESNSNQPQFIVYKNGSFLAVIDFKDLIDDLSDKYKKTGQDSFSNEEMSLSYEDNVLRAKIYFSNIYGSEKSGSNISTQEDILVSFK